MGMYTEFHFNSELNNNSSDIIDILKYMIGEQGSYIKLPKHPLFETDRWMFMLCTDSYYFDADTISTLRYDKTAKAYFLCIRCNLKNYNDEIEKFINWITPYLAKTNGEFLGFYRYEEYEKPTLIYMK